MQSILMGKDVEDEAKNREALKYWSETGYMCSDDIQIDYNYNANKT